jgi:hypothetical protein
MSKTKSTPLCDKCKKPLEDITCPACNGTGFYLGPFGAKKQCQNCKGSGRVLKCPDEMKHILEDLGVALPLDPKPIYNSFLKGKPFVLPSEEKIIPPWHSDYPKPWHPNHPLNPNNPLNPNSPIKPGGVIRNSPFNRNQYAQKNSGLNQRGRLPGEIGTDAPPPTEDKKQ